MTLSKVVWARPLYYGMYRPLYYGILILVLPNGVSNLVYVLELALACSYKLNFETVSRPHPPFMFTEVFLTKASNKCQIENGCNYGCNYGICLVTTGINPELIGGFCSLQMYKNGIESVLVTAKESVNTTLCKAN